MLAPLLRKGAWPLSLAFSLCFGLATIAVGWMSYRPFVGVPILLLAIGTPAAALWQMRRRAKAAPSSAMPSSGNDAPKAP
ncbi:MAG: hypothetical protein H5U40_19410 [Polyangiaceae bacterium]|nr:hypothetical protein [Polyangiaceae bacterium]